MHFPPLINMLKFGGCASIISCLLIVYIRSCQLNGCIISRTVQHVHVPIGHAVANTLLHGATHIPTASSTCQIHTVAMTATLTCTTYTLPIHSANVVSTETDKRSDTFRQYITCSNFNRFTESYNSQCVSHLAAFFIVYRTNT